MEKRRKVMMQFRIDPDLLEKVDTTARSRDEFEGNRSLFIRKALNDLIAKYEKKPAAKEAA